jgi:hypothetical protein
MKIRGGMEKWLPTIFLQKNEIKRNNVSILWHLPFLQKVEALLSHVSSHTYKLCMIELKV